MIFNGFSILSFINTQGVRILPTNVNEGSKINSKTTSNYFLIITCNRSVLPGQRERSVDIMCLQSM